MGAVRIIQATHAAVGFVADHLRQEDRAALAAMGLDTSSVQASFKRSLWCEVVRQKGRIVAAFGVCPSSSPDVGLPWLACTGDADATCPSVARVAQGSINRMLQDRPALVNFVHAADRKALRWLQTHGFELEPELEMPATGAAFVPVWAGAMTPSLGYVAAMRLALCPTEGGVQ